ncbi:hypothetical protein PM082_023359 [Marasmius tenuissimus]|nr:hypothetical protein PM082_023359 [Marasmius tenuissimus]
MTSLGSFRDFPTQLQRHTVVTSFVGRRLYVCVNPLGTYFVVASKSYRKHKETGIQHCCYHPQCVVARNPHHKYTRGKKTYAQCVINVHSICIRLERNLLSLSLNGRNAGGRTKSCLCIVSPRKDLQGVNYASLCLRLSARFRTKFSYRFPHHSIANLPMFLSPSQEHYISSNPFRELDLFHQGKGTNRRACREEDSVHNARH